MKGFGNGETPGFPTGRIDTLQSGATLIDKWTQTPR